MRVGFAAMMELLVWQVGVSEMAIQYTQDLFVVVVEMKTLA